MELVSTKMNENANYNFIFTRNNVTLLRMHELWDLQFQEFNGFDFENWVHFIVVGITLTSNLDVNN